MRLTVVPIVAALALAALSARPVTAGETTAPKTGFRFAAIDEKSLGLWDGEKPVLVYNHGLMSKAGVPAKFDRANYIHPLYGLDGEVLTDDFPKDHYHHRGVFWGWPHIRIAGKQYESWVPTSVRYKLERLVRQEVAEGKAIIEAENGWYVGEKKAAGERLLMTVCAATEKSRAIDFELTWTAADEPVVLWGAEGKSYGGFTIRFAPRKDTAITVPSGRTKEDLAITKLEWADFAGKFEGAPGRAPRAGERSGAALFIATTHPDYPPTWLTRHYGCLCVGWPGIKPGTLEPGKPVRCCYRVWLHRGDADLDALKAAYEAYAKKALF